MEWTCWKTFLVIFLVLGIASAHVAPPSDVVLHCGNMLNKLTWRYDNPPSGLRFRVDIGKVFDYQGDLAPLWVDSPDLQADMSFLSDQREDYFLMVTAVLGEAESEAAPADGISFSYNVNSPAAQKCSLDLPHATVLDQQDNSVLLSFQHPWLTYQHALLSNMESRGKRKRRHGRLDDPLPVFKYDVTLDKKEFAHLRCTEQVCERKLPVDAGQQEHCASIRGELESVGVHGTQEYCARLVPGNKHVVIAVVASLSVLAAVAVVVLMICLKKTKASSHLPRSLRFEGIVEETPVSSVPVSDSSTPLMVVERPVSTGELESRREPEPSVEDDAVGAVVEERRGYMAGDQMEEDEDTETSDENAYEKRHVVVRLSPGEDLEGYRG